VTINVGMARVWERLLQYSIHTGMARYCLQLGAILIAILTLFYILFIVLGSCINARDIKSFCEFELNISEVMKNYYPP